MKRELAHAVTLMQEGGVNYDAAVRTFKRLFITQTLERNRGNQTKAAFEMGMHRNTLRLIMAELDLDATDEETGSLANSETEMPA
jgi:Fis family transcriptional regulator